MLDSEPSDRYRERMQRVRGLLLGRRIVVAVLVVVGLALASLALPGGPIRAFDRAAAVMGIHKTIEQRLDEHRESVRIRCEPRYAAAGVPWPPRRLRLVAFKQEKRLEVYATAAGGAWRRVGEHPILAASGALGPKLARGDRQVPEGFYALESLNPNSRFHLALRVGYPNAEDLERARVDGRSDLGGDIMIHGGESSVGCLAMGDPVAEELFVAAASAGVEAVSIWIAPCDLRTRRDVEPPAGAPAWTRELWDALRAELERLPSP